MKNVFIVLLIVLTNIFVSQALTIPGQSVWETYFEDEKIKIEYKLLNCEYTDFFNQEFVILQITNKSNNKISVEWQEQYWYDNICNNCEQESNEFRKKTIVNANETVIGQCNFHSNLKIFSKFTEKLEDMPGVEKIVVLTKFELKNITTKDE